MDQFPYIIRDWETWKHVSGKTDAFQDMVEDIFRMQSLPLARMEKMPPSTNAVFRVGNYVIKIYAPREAQMDPEEELRIERFAMQRARKAGVPVPGISAWGCYHDRYDFFYLISRYIKGESFSEAAARMNAMEKLKTGAHLRKLISRMHISCTPFRQIDLVTDPERQVRWQSYTDAFRKDRREYLERLLLEDPVFVHGDLNGNNVRIDENGTIWFLDFAEAVPAPVVYEQMYVAVELFQMDIAFLKGYFQDLALEEMVQMITEGLLIHDFGGDLVKRYFGGPQGLYTTEALRARVRKKLEDYGYTHLFVQGRGIGEEEYGVQ